MRTRLVVPVSFLDRFRGADPGLMAGAVAFNGFFTLIPASFALLAALSFIPESRNARIELATTLRALAPDEFADFVLDLIDNAADVIAGKQVTVIVISLLVALWAGSRGIYALQKALARIERHSEHRPAWRVRLIGIGLTLGAGVALILVSVVIAFGEPTVDFLAELTAIESLRAVRVFVGVPAAALAVYLILYAVYRFGPPQPISGAGWAALLSTLAAGGISWAFSLYLSRFGSNAFGVLGAVGLGLLWFYLTAYVLLFVAAAVGFGRRHRQTAGGSSGYEAR
jgi:membrane protein